MPVLKVGPLMRYYIDNKPEAAVYGATVHRAQGSTYETVWVDYQDILKNRNRREAFQCLYVACSRPTTKLLLA
jgi:hypothetical protein